MSIAKITSRRNPNLENTRSFFGSLMSFLVQGGESNGRCALVEVEARPGSDPQPHFHLWEHELCFILEGEAEALCEGESSPVVLRAGDVVFFPQGRAHVIRVVSPCVKSLIIIQAVGEHAIGLDQYFVSMSMPAQTMEVPEGESSHENNPDPEGMAAIVTQAKGYGVVMLSPEEIRKRLPALHLFGGSIS